MLSRLKNIKKYFYDVPKAILLSEVRNTLSIKQKFKMTIAFMLKMTHSFLKVLSPFVFGHALEAIAKGEENKNIMQIGFSPEEWLYLSIALSAMMPIENYITRFILAEIDDTFLANYSLRLIQHAHRIEMLEHVKVKNELMSSHYLIQNSCAQLPNEVINNLYPSLCDMLVGITLIWHQFGRKHGIVFLGYALSNLFLLNWVLLCIAGYDDKTNRVSAAQGRFFFHESESIAYVETIRLNNKQEFEILQSKHLLQELMLAKQRFRSADFFYSIVNKIPQFIMPIYIVAHLFNAKKLSIDDIDESVFLIAYVSVFMSSVDRMSLSLKNLINLATALNKISTLLTIKEEIKGELPEKKPVNSKNSRVCIEFENVTFGYDKNKPILKGVDFSIQSKNTIGIVGKSGSGKSTIAKLLMGFYRQNQGTIKINHVDSREYSLSELRSKIAYVGQRPEIFSQETLKYNVLYGRPNYHAFFASKEQKPIKETHPLLDYHLIELDQMGVDDDVLCKKLMLDVGLNELYSERDLPNRSAGLSGGQQQQLSIARVLPRNADIFILDEPTSALDSFTEYSLLSHLEKLTAGKTKIIIAHRLSTIKNSDLILVVDDGKVVEQGTHEALLKQKGLYSHYWEMQTETPISNLFNRR